MPVTDVLAHGNWRRCTRIVDFIGLLYGIGEGAAYLSVPSSTLASWAYGYKRHVHGGGTSTTRPVITAAMQRIRPAIDALSTVVSISALAAQAQIYQFCCHVADPQRLADAVRSGTPWDGRLGLGLARRRRQHLFRRCGERGPQL